MQSLKDILRAVGERIRKWISALNNLTMRDGNPMTDEEPPYTNCMNCGTELSGMYCHKCGQFASSPTLKISQFVKEYIKNFLSLDRQALPTLSNLLFHPGHLLKDYCAGRYASYLHPLKLNFFLLIFLITLFSIFGTDAKIQNSFSEATNNDIFVEELSISMIASDSLYISKIATSPKDTVTMIAPQVTLARYQQIFDIVEVVGLDDNQAHDTLITVVPRVLIEEECLIPKDEYYVISHTERNISNTMVVVHKFAELWQKATSIIFSHFPLLMLFTLPFLMFPMRRCFKKRNYSKAYYYIFSLYYVAFIELLVTILYLIAIIFDVRLQGIQWPLFIAISSYLTVALKQTFDVKSWYKSAVAALFINCTYLICCIVCMSFISLIGIIMVFV